MAKILVVDDEEDLEILIKQKFRQKIKNNDYEFVFAGNGFEALDRLEERQDIDLVLCDINMPCMDGLTLLSKLNDKHTILKSVMVSAYGDMDNIRTAMNRGAFDFITKPVDFKDMEVTIDKTYEYVLQIRQTLQAIKENNILKMYVDETVINFMDTHEFEASLMKNETIEATVAFIDICGFTSLSEVEKPDAVVQLLNSYFDIMVTEIIKHNGFIDKFIGDAIMAVFRNEDHLKSATDACLAVKNKIEKIASISDEIAFKPKLSIGINSGELISGNIGSATIKRLDYTVIGDVVNTAQRVQSAAKPGQIAITESTYLKLKDHYKCLEVGEISLKNKSLPTMIFEVLQR